MNSPITSTEEKRFNWSQWSKRASTIISAIIAMLGSVMVYYNQLDSFEKATWPWWVPLAITMAIPALTVMIPVATSFKQKNLE